MREISLALTADVHLATPFSFLEESRATLLRRQQEKSLQDVCRYCKSHDLQFLFIAGDLFDRPDVEPELVSRTQQSFHLCPATNVIIVPGNHDPYFAGGIWDHPGWPSHVHIVKKKSEFLEFREAKLRVYAAPFYSQSSEQSLFEEFSPALDKSYVNILLMHGDLVSSGQSSRYNPIPKEWLAASALDLAILGHWHQASELIQLNQRVAYIYPGTLMGRGFAECGEKGFYSGKIRAVQNIYQNHAKKEITLTFVPLQNTTFYRKELYLDKLSSLQGAKFDSYAAYQEGLLQELRQAIWHLSAKPERHLFSITLLGNSVFPADLAYLQASLEDLCFDLNLVDKTRKPVQLSSFLEENSLRSEVAAVCLELESYLTKETETSYFVQQSWREFVSNLSAEHSADLPRIYQLAVHKLFQLLEEES